ncbi:MAG: adenosylhomocysteinase [Methylococcaceae bacterium]
MDMNFANQALSIAYLWQQGADLENIVHPVSTAIDQQVAVMKLAAMGISIDNLSSEQLVYLSYWKEGT